LKIRACDKMIPYYYEHGRGKKTDMKKIQTPTSPGTKNIFFRTRDFRSKSGELDANPQYGFNANSTRGIESIGGIAILNPNILTMLERHSFQQEEEQKEIMNV
jgi:hypothetical protein